MPSVVIKQAKMEHEGGKKFVGLNKGAKELNKRKNMPVSAFLNKVVSLSEKPIVIDLSTGLLPRDVRKTNGYFTLTYNPENSPKRVKDKPYTFGQDMIAAKISVSGPRHLKALGKRIPEIGWILKWSYFDDRLFAVAKKHPGIAYGFNVRWADYADMIEKKAEEMGIDIDHKPYLAYITGKKQMDELRAKFQMMPKPTKDDYQSVLDEVDKEEKIYG